MTPFGIFCRKLRFENNISLKTQATALSVISSYLLALEHGKKGNPPKVIIQKISKLFSLSPVESKDLKQPVSESPTMIKIPQGSEAHVY